MESSVWGWEHNGDKSKGDRAGEAIDELENKGKADTREDTTEQQGRRMEH